VLHQLCIPRDIYKVELGCRAKDIIYLDVVVRIMTMLLLSEISFQLFLKRVEKMLLRKRFHSSSS